MIKSMAGPTFGVILEVPQSDTEDGHPADLYVADYVMGATPAQDRLGAWRVLADSSSDERYPVATPEGGAAFLSERGKPGIYLQGSCQNSPLLLRQNISAFAVAPDGQEWAFLAQPRGEPAGLWRFQPGQQPVRQDLGEMLPQSLAYTPDGQGLLLSDDHVLARLNRASGQVTELAEGTFQDFSLSPDGSQLVYLRPDAWGCQLRVLNLGTGQDRQLGHSRDETGTFDWPAYQRPVFTPEGSRVLYGVSSADGSCGVPLTSDLRVVALSGGPASVLAEEVLSGVPMG